MTDILAYPVPFVLERTGGKLHRLKNASSESLRGISLTLHGGGLMSTSMAATLEPGETLDITIAGRNLARSTILVVRWFRPDGVEYLWRISF